jgi:hypothetical protein
LLLLIKVNNKTFSKLKNNPLIHVTPFPNQHSCWFDASGLHYTLFCSDVAMIDKLCKILLEKSLKIWCSGGGCQDKIFCLFCHTQDLFTQKHKQELKFYTCNYPYILSNVYFYRIWWHLFCVIKKASLNEIKIRTKVTIFEKVCRRV